MDIPSSVGGDAESAPVFAMEEGDTDSELESADVAAPLFPLPERASDSTVETGDMVGYKTAFQFGGFDHAIAQVRFKFQHRIVNRELRVLAEYINHGHHGEVCIPFKLNSTGDCTISTVDEAKEKFIELHSVSTKFRHL